MEEVSIGKDKVNRGSKGSWLGVGVQQPSCQSSIQRSPSGLGYEQSDSGCLESWEELARCPMKVGSYPTGAKARQEAALIAPVV